MKNLKEIAIDLGYLDDHAPRKPRPMGAKFKDDLSSIMDTYAAYFILKTMADIYGEREYLEAQKILEKLSLEAEKIPPPPEKEVDLGDGPASWYNQPGKQWTGD